MSDKNLVDCLFHIMDGRANYDVDEATIISAGYKSEESAVNDAEMFGDYCIARVSKWSNGSTSWDVIWSSEWGL